MTSPNLPGGQLAPKCSRLFSCEKLAFSLLLICAEKFSHRHNFLCNRSPNRSRSRKRHLSTSSKSASRRALSRAVLFQAGWYGSRSGPAPTALHHGLTNFLTRGTPLFSDLFMTKGSVASCSGKFGSSIDSLYGYSSNF